MGLAAAWVVGFCLVFYAMPLSRLGTSRAEFWQQVPFELLDLIDPPPPEPGDPPSGLGYLPQRLDLFAVATFLLLGSRALGSLLLRAWPSRFLEPGLERETFAWGLGLSAWSLLVLGLGLVGLLSQGLFVAILLTAIAADAVLWWRTPPKDSAPRNPHSTLLPLLVTLPFLALMALGSTLPPTDFDTKAYHLLGPKEFYLAGRVSHLLHNVYTSFPFLTEMLTLSGMVVRGDWFRGALVGKVVLAAFGPLTAVAILAAGRRWFGTTAGVLGAVVCTTTPWTHVTSTIAYAEGGLSFFLFAATFATLLAAESMRSNGRFLGPVLLAGLMAGSAMACKYPALVTVVLPAGGVLVGLAYGFGRSSSIPAIGGAYAVGVLLAVGPWLLKNTGETGNPVYPLAYPVFGGRGLTPELAGKWTAGHATPDYDVTRLPVHLADVTLRNDWLGPLLYALAPLALLVVIGVRSADDSPDDSARQRRIVVALWSYLVFLFVVWWAFTHRIDRFWVPMLPVTAFLAGIGGTRLQGRAWRTVVVGAVLTSAMFALAFVAVGLAGDNRFLADLETLRRLAAPPAVAAANERLPGDARVLCVGEAQLFDATFDPVYDTVFDESRFDIWFAERRDDVPSAEWKLQPTTAIRDRLRTEGITHLLVNWTEIRRYRETYGFSDFPTPERFASLVEGGLLEPPIDGPPSGDGGVPTWQLFAVIRGE